MFSELGIGTFPQWILLITVLGGGVTVFIKGIPQRTKANSDAKQAENNDYAQQIKELRVEMHGYRNELHVLQQRLSQAESSSRVRADRITNMMFIVRLLISELRRLDPQSVIVNQAEALLEQMDRADTHPMTATETAERAVTKAKQTVKAAEATVTELGKDGE